MKSMYKYVSIAIGGMIGASCRYLVSLLFTEDFYLFPWPTLLVNLIGCYLLSFLLHNKTIKDKLPPDVFIGLTVGVLGSFTTFSTVMVEGMELYTENIFLSLAYLFISVIGGILLCFLGLLTAKKIGDRSI